MKRFFRKGATTNLRCFVLPLVLIAIGMSALAQQFGSQSSDAARVLALETLWNQAELGKDTSALSNLLANNFIFVDVDGSFSQKADFLTSVKNRLEKIDTLANDSVATYVYDGAVIVSGIYREKGSLNGKAYTHRGRFTDTWVRQGSSWVCVASQSTLIQRSLATGQ